MHVVFAINVIHTPGVEKYQQDKNVYRALLREPESELEAADTNRIELLDQQNSETERAQKPDGEAARHKPEVRTPIRQAFVLVHEQPRSCYGDSM